MQSDLGCIHYLFVSSVISLPFVFKVYYTNKYIIDIVLSVYRACCLILFLWLLGS